MTAAAPRARTRFPRLAVILAGALLLSACAAEPVELDAAVQLPPGVTEPFAGEQYAFVTSAEHTALAEGIVFLPGQNDFPVGQLVSEHDSASYGYSDLITVAAGIAGRADAVRIIAVLPEAASLEGQPSFDADAAPPGFPPHEVTAAELAAAGVPGTVVVANLFDLEHRPEQLRAFLALLHEGWEAVLTDRGEDPFTLGLDDDAQRAAVAALVEAGYPVRQAQLFDFSFLPDAPSADSR